MFVKEVKLNRLKIGLVFLVLLILGLVYWLHSSKSPKESSKAKDKFIVEITDKGFSPRNIQIPQYGSVSFINRDHEPHLVASNNHPLHELYPDFVSKQAIYPGESWSFTFTRVGAWPYHDHLNPKLQAQVEVKGDQPAPNVKTTDSPLSSLRDKVISLAKEQGSIVAWNYLKSSYPIDLYGGLHSLAHYLGGQLYNEHGLEGLSYCDASFNYGCYHGFLEEYILEKGIEQLTDIVNYCQTDLPAKSAIGCYHGMGHGLTLYYKYNLDKALTKCDELIPSDLAQKCYKGVFMENSSQVDGSAIKYRLNNNDLWPCNIVLEKYKNACYSNLPGGLLGIYSMDFLKVSQICLKGDNDEYVESCLFNLGSQIAATKRAIISDGQETCMKITVGINNYRCKIGAAEEYVILGRDYSQVKSEICDQLPDNWRAICIDRIAQVN